MRHSIAADRRLETGFETAWRGYGKPTTTATVWQKALPQIQSVTNYLQYILPEFGFMASCFAKVVGQIAMADGPRIICRPREFDPGKSLQPLNGFWLTVLQPII